MLREQNPDEARRVAAFARKDRETLIALVRQQMPQPRPAPEPKPAPNPKPTIINLKDSRYDRGTTGGQATLYANVRSVLETDRRRGIGILRAIRLTLDQTALAIPPWHQPPQEREQLRMRGFLR